MTQTPAGWFADPQDPTQWRYWDGTAWTEHRAPRGSTPTDQLTQATGQIADEISKGFTALGTWVNQQTSKAPTFASIAASCRDEPARQPLSVAVELAVAPGLLAALGAPGSSVVCRLVPNPWDPATPQGVAVFVSTTMLGRLPAELEAAYCAPLAQLASGGVVATGTATLGDPVRLQLPSVEAFSAS